MGPSNHFKGTYLSSELPQNASYQVFPFEKIIREGLNLPKRSDWFLSLFWQDVMVKLNFSYVGVRYQYVTLPINPTKSSSFATTPMGATAYITSGTVMYNPLSSPQGNLASDKEWVSLDPCYGHSSPDSQYHYHAVNI